jgi:hypothetical protein
MPACRICGTEDLTNRCSHCREPVCGAHLLPENHDCVALKGGEGERWFADKFENDSSVSRLESESTAGHESVPDSPQSEPDTDSTSFEPTAESSSTTATPQSDDSDTDIVGESVEPDTTAHSTTNDPPSRDGFGRRVRSRLGSLVDRTGSRLKAVGRRLWSRSLRTTITIARLGGVALVYLGALGVIYSWLATEGLGEMALAAGTSAGGFVLLYVTN